MPKSPNIQLQTLTNPSVLNQIKYRSKFFKLYSRTYNIEKRVLLRIRIPFIN